MIPHFQLPPLVRFAYEIERQDWERRGRPLRDMDDERYVYLATLERFGLKCPHPIKKLIREDIDGFECQVCRSYVIPITPP